MRSLRYLVPGLILLLGGCQMQGIYVPVFSSGEQFLSRTRLYVVRRGDTLYSIAFRFGLDYKSLARANGISPPYMIYVNQRLRITGSPTPSTDSGPDKNDPPTTAARSRAKATKPPTPVTAPDVPDSGIQWHWPYEGEVVGKFSLSGDINKGIDIRGKSGDPVRSSADGIVVYAGGGLRGYGKLVIVKHNERYLSAYGHNQSLLVKEGETVKRGQVVARIGGPNGNSNLLHFEIRRDGKPRDPLDYLPSRNSTGD